MSETQQEPQSTISVLSPILDEYTKWYSSALKSLAVEEQHAPNPAVSVLKNFLTTLNQDHFITNRRAQRILDGQQKMLGAYQQDLLSKTDDFIKAYERFYQELRSLERDCVLEDHGLDYLTGLKSKVALIDDINKHLELLSRKGEPFSLALVQINRYDEIVQSMDKTSSFENTRAIAELIKQQVRTFDEVYRTGPGEFVAVLRQSDIAGGLAALERINRGVERLSIQINFAEGIGDLSLSSCVAEPVSHDTAEDLIKNLRYDLNRMKNDSGGQVLEYHELSPLQRYIQEEHNS